jgi:heptose I phosphotransferase
LKSFAFERWDDGRLTVNVEDADLLRRHGLTTFADLVRVRCGSIAKDVLRERMTARFSLPDAAGEEHHFYIKRHRPPSWKEYVKPWLRLNRPSLGARPEWEAILRFHEAGIATMVPVALGESGGYSLLITRSIEGCRKLSVWLREASEAHNSQVSDATRRTIDAVAEVARSMHASGLHHQDFYTHHLLLPEGDGCDALFVIDLGRARQEQRLSRRWIVKDLAQLSYSAPHCTKADRVRFLKAYLGRPLESADRRLIQQIGRKVRSIARHSNKHDL